MSTQEGSPQDVTLREYVRVIWRRKWIVVGMVVLFTALALGYSLMKTPLYQASATLIYESPIDVNDPLSANYVDPSQREVELDSVASVIASPELVASARKELRSGEADQVYSVEAAPETSMSMSGASTVIITAVSPDAGTAARAANAYATAFSAFRKSQAQDRIRQAERVIQDKMDTYQTSQARQSADYITLSQRLQDLQISEVTVTGNFRVLVPATRPLAPFTPKPLRNAALGLAAGLVLGIGLVLLLQQFDTRVRTGSEAMAIFQMPVIGTIRKLSKQALGERPLTVLSDPQGPAAEAVRKLRGNLEFANVDGDLKSIFITSALQHEGKTLTVCNLALSMAATGVRVVLVDGDLRRPQVHACLGLGNATGVSTVLTGRSELLATVQARTVGPRISKLGDREQAAGGSGGERLFVLTSGPVPPDPAEFVASRSFAAMIGRLEEQFDVVIIDAPSILAVGDPEALARHVDGLMFLIDLTRARRPQLEEAAQQVDRMPCRKLGLIVVSQAPRYGYAHDTYYHAQGASPLDPGPGTTKRRSRTSALT